VTEFCRKFLLVGCHLLLLERRFHAILRWR
jgi:hypothetical protein